MANAGYDPRAAVSFWERAAREGGFDKGPSFFSTHPSSAQRLVRLKTYLPRALSYYNRENIQREITLKNKCDH